MTIDVRHGDCLVIMQSLADNSVDSIVTDPPYDLTSGKRGGSGVASLNVNSPAGRSRITTGNAGGFMGKAWDGTGIAFDPATWRECLRVLKPGGYLLSFGGTRTSHRMAVAIEDAGFEIRDSIAWLYGSGFPKSRDVGKDMDRMAGAEREVISTVPARMPQAQATNWGNPGVDNFRDARKGTVDMDITAPATDDARKWQGWGTALKPAHEPIIMARKPFPGTVAANVLTHGTGAINVDACRIGTDERTYSTDSGMNAQRFKHGARPADYGRGRNETATVQGRWPANVVLDEDQAAVLDEQTGTLHARGNTHPTRTGDTTWWGKGGIETPTDPGDSGGASRYFYVAKAPAKERPSYITDDGRKISHPTVKPLALMRWLIRLITPPGGTILDPFAGSGTTLEAALLEGFDAIGIESEADYIPLIHARLDRNTP